MQSPIFHLLQCFFSGLVLTLFITGCGNTKSDPNHETSHSHEHDHDHDHDHQHSEPRFGGQMVEVGHTHNPDGLRFYFAEVLPVKDNRISFYLSVEDEAGNSSSPTIASTEFMAYVSDDESETTVSREIIFQLREDNGDSPMPLFETQIPTNFVNSRLLSVVVPKLTLGGERLNFTFEVSNKESLQTDHANDSSDPGTDTKDENQPLEKEEK